MTDLIATLQAAAGNAAGEALYVEDVFSTYLYDAQASSFAIDNGIDLDGEGGLVWIKKRSGTNTRNHTVFDSERGPDSSLYVNTNGAAFSMSGLGFTSTVFNSDGFTTGDAPVTNENNGSTYASWTFRKAPKFFDVVTYTGDGTASQTISHNLGSTPGVVILKKTSGSSSWFVWHRGLSSYRSVLYLSGTSQELTNYDEMAADPDASNIYVGGNVSFNNSNNSGASYVAYLFAHNDSDGDFGEDADQDIIKCGSYAGSASDVSVNLGFEPQFVITKNISSASNWLMMDTMRGMPHGDGATLAADSNAAENGVFGGDNLINPTANGFIAKSGKTASNTNGDNHIYIAIRRGPMKTPESGTEVFAVDGESGGSGVEQYYYGYAGFPVDLAITHRKSGGDHGAYSRLTSSSLITNSTAAESSVSDRFDNQEGYYYLSSGWTTDTDRVTHSFRRAPGFFDVVAYTGDGVAGRTVAHNLGVEPELIILKIRETQAGNNNWVIYASGPGETKGAYFTTGAFQVTSSFWNDTAPTTSVFTLGSGTVVNANAKDFIAYLFATVDGVSKVGSYTGNGSSQTIDCGFSTGARFFLVKASSTTGDWHVFDTERGIIAGNDPYLELNNTNAEDTDEDAVDPVSSGVIVNEVSASSINTSGVTYIYLAVA